MQELNLLFEKNCSVSIHTTLMTYSSETLRKMIKDSGGVKKAIAEELGISRSTLDSWIKPGNDNLLNFHKVLSIAKILKVDPAVYYPGIETELNAVQEPMGVYGNDEHVSFINSLVDQIIKDPKNEDMINSLKQELKNLVLENTRYRRQLTKVMNQLSSLK